MCTNVHCVRADRLGSFDCSAFNIWITSFLRVPHFVPWEINFHGTKKIFHGGKLSTARQGIFFPRQEKKSPRQEILADAAGNPKRHQLPSQTNPSAKFQTRVHVQQRRCLLVRRFRLQLRQVWRRCRVCSFLRTTGNLSTSSGLDSVGVWGGDSFRTKREVIRIRREPI